MKTKGLILALLFLCGCSNLRHSWNQGQQGDGMLRSARHGAANHTDFRDSLRHGWDQELENWSPFSAASRGLTQDLRQIFSP